MQCRLQIGHTGLDVVHNSGDQLCMPGREVVPGLSLEEPLPGTGSHDDVEFRMRGYQGVAAKPRLH